ncbi:MAG TPA: succinate dehydrogenase assembly factor 2 [Hyphomicrobium sp.]|jgi:antitoxin CptB
MTDDMEIRRRRAAYRASHRGTKEMDFILGRYAEAHLPGMTQAALDDFERLLTLPDPVLTDWFSLASAPGEPAFVALIKALRRHHGLADVER